MHISCVIYHFLEAALFWDVSASFWFFLLIINRESHGVVFALTNEKRLQNQVYRQIKSKLYGYIWIWQKFTVWKGWLMLIYIISYLHFINLNNILTLLQKLCMCQTKPSHVCLVFCLPDLRNQNKCKLCLYGFQYCLLWTLSQWLLYIFSFLWKRMFIFTLTLCHFTFTKFLSKN